MKHSASQTAFEAEVAMAESIIAAQPEVKGKENVRRTRRTSIDLALKAARGRLRWRRAMRGFASTFFLPAFCGAIWVMVSRFTLLELPRWPVLLFFPLWLVSFLVWLFRDRPTQAQSLQGIWIMRWAWKSGWLQVSSFGFVKNMTPLSRRTDFKSNCWQTLGSFWT